MSKLGQINRVKHAFNSTLLTTIIHICLFLASYSTAPLFGQLPLLEISSPVAACTKFCSPHHQWYQEV
jgi:hypothetical protein